jgi:plasmid stabilization system protein ParE
MEIRWTEQAVDDLIGIRSFIARDSEVFAQLVAARLINAVDQLSTFPESGRIVPERGDSALRELVRPPYRIVYECTPDAVVILTVFHAARMFPEQL